jgi:hypothetical protein
MVLERRNIREQGERHAFGGRGEDARGNRGGADVLYL